MSNFKLFFKNKKILFIIPVIILIIVLGALFFNNQNNIKNTKKNSFCDSNGDCLKDEYGNYFSRTEFNILELDELYVLFRVTSDNKVYRSISDLSLYDAYVLIFNRFESVNNDDEENNNDSGLNFSATEVSDMYKSGVCFSKLFKFKYMDFDNYKYDANKNVFVKDDTLRSKRDNEYANVVAKKIVNYKYVDGYYNIDVKYLFANNNNMFDKGKNAYGSLNDISNESKKIVSLSSGFDAQMYLNNNFDKIKNSLDTYHYKIKVMPTGRIYLVDFKVN